jgi:hypothetical protein
MLCQPCPIGLACRCAYKDATRAEAEPQLHVSQNITARSYSRGQPRPQLIMMVYSTTTSVPQWKGFAMFDTYSTEYITILTPHDYMLQ